MSEQTSYEKVKALVERTIAECKQQGFTIREMQNFLTDMQIEVMHREEKLKDESF